MKVPVQKTQTDEHVIMNNIRKNQKSRGKVYLMDVKFGRDSPLEDKFDSELNPKPKYI